MKVLVIPEDQELDQYIVKPVVEQIFSDLGRSARVVVLPEPRLRGASEALDATLINEIIRDRAMFDLFLLIIDRDCNREGHEEKAAQREREHPGKLIACLAIQEVEVWLLALYTEMLSARFAEIRAHCDPKEVYAEPLLAKLGESGPGKGRKHAMRAIAGNWKALCARCPEIAELRDRIATQLATS